MNDDELGERADALGLKVDRLADAVKELGERTTRTERGLTRNAVVAVVAIAVLVAAAWIGYRQVVTGSQLADVTVAQDRVTQQALCPVFALVLGGYDPTTRPVGPARDQYEATFDQFRQSYQALRCTGDFVPPRTGG